MGDQSDWIEIQLDTNSRALSADGAEEMLRDSLGLLKAIDRGMSTHGTETVSWEIVEARMQSPLTVRLRGSESRAIIEAVGDGMESLNSSKECPPHFNQEALRFVKQLVSHGKQYAVNPVFATFTKRVPVEHVAGENADWAIRVLSLRKQKRCEYGSLRGELMELSASSRPRDRLVLVDRVTGEKTHCYVGEELDAEIRAAWKKRVVLTGRIVTNRETRQKQIYVEHVRILRDRKDLSQLEDVRGVDITGGTESAEYIRNLRDADED